MLSVTYIDKVSQYSQVIKNDSLVDIFTDYLGSTHTEILPKSQEIIY